MIFLKEALEQMEETDKKGRLIPFDMEVITADRNKKTGGDILPLKKVTLLKKQIGKLNKSVKTENAGNSKKPNHWSNSTRNIQLPNGQKRKIHIRLITKFNNQLVVY